MLPGLKEPSGLQFRLEELGVMYSDKTYESTDRPSESYIELTFPKQGILGCILFQNYYTYAITIKQGLAVPGSSSSLKWRTILRNYKLMKSPHFEGDAQDCHLIKAEKKDFQTIKSKFQANFKCLAAMASSDIMKYEDKIEKFEEIRKIEFA